MRYEYFVWHLRVGGGVPVQPLLVRVPLVQAWPASRPSSSLSLPLLRVSSAHSCWGLSSPLPVLSCTTVNLLVSESLGMKRLTLNWASPPLSPCPLLRVLYPLCSMQGGGREGMGWG